MIERVWASFSFPESAYLGKRVFKTLFHEHGTLTATDKAALTDDVDVITWQYTLKPLAAGGTLLVPPYADDQREYLEIAAIQVDLKTGKRVGRIHEVIQRAIPYPVVAVFRLDQVAWLGFAQKRFHQSHRGQIVADEVILTDPISLATATPAQEAFLSSLGLSGLPQNHIFGLYTGWVDRTVALECARLSGTFSLDGSQASPTERRDHRRQQLAACHAIEQELAEKRAAAKREGQVARLVSLNNDIKHLESRLAQLSAGL